MTHAGLQSRHRCHVDKESVGEDQRQTRRKQVSEPLRWSPVMWGEPVSQGGGQMGRGRAHEGTGWQEGVLPRTLPGRA